MENFKRLSYSKKIKLETYLKQNNIKTRPNCGNGFWVGFLLPVCIGICFYKYPTNDNFRFSSICAFGLIIDTILFIFSENKNKNIRMLKIIIMTALLYTINLDCGLPLSLSTSILLSVGFKYCFETILKYCPRSFSIGEALLISQAVFLFVCGSLKDIFQSFYKTPESDHEIITNILEAGVFAVLLVVLTLFTMRSNMNLQKFSLIVISYIVSMIALLHFTLNRSPLLWMILYIFTDLKRILMIVYWAAASGLATIAIATQTSLGSKASTARRKIFHLLAVAVYLPGFIFECNLIYLASGIALAALIALESVRKLNLGKLSEFLDDGFYVFADEKDAGGLSLTPIYLLLGIAMPLFIHPSPCHSKWSLVILTSGVLSIGLGDTAASFFGSKFGRIKWPNSSKTIVGTAASICTQLLTIIILHKLGFIDHGFMSTSIILIAVIINTLIEARTDQIDNLTLPLVTFGILVLGLGA